VFIEDTRRERVSVRAVSLYRSSSVYLDVRSLTTWCAILTSLYNANGDNPPVRSKREVPCLSEVYAGNKCRNMELIAMVYHCG